MPSAAAPIFPIYSFETYLDLETRSSGKHEFYHGQITAMAGGTNLHNIIASAASYHLSSLLRKRNCYVLNSDARVETPKSAASFYPDASVHCNQFLPPAELTTKAPVLVLEVLSPSTRNYDLNAKRKEYFRIPTLRHYLLLESESIEALLFTRDANQTWPKDPQVFTDPNASIPLTALKINLKLRDLYRQSGLLTIKS